MKKNLKKRTLLIVVALLVSASLTSCMEMAGFATGFSQGYSSSSRGYNLIGSYSSESACKNACIRAGYSNAYEYYPSTSNCFCK